VFADLTDLPPTYLTCGDEDSLLGQSLEMTKALTQATVPTTLSVVAGLDHAFPFLEDSSSVVGEEMSRARAWVRRIAGIDPGGDFS
jgi:acetyl esterase